MNALLLTQSGSLRLFHDLAVELSSTADLRTLGFYVSHRSFYEEFVAQEPSLEAGDHVIAKEWEIMASAREIEANRELIRSYEEKLGVPSLWPALIADRRVWLGQRCTFRQDYKPRFSHEEMLAILQAGLVRMERLFDEVRPDVVISFICVTFGEFLAYLFAKSRGIPFLNLRPTRIENYVTYGESIFEPSRRIESRYNDCLSRGMDPGAREQARGYIESVQGGDVVYEGVLTPDRARSGPAPHWMPRLHAIARLLRNEWRYRRRRIKDNHDAGILIPFLYRRFLNPLRARRTARALSAQYARQDELSSTDFVFFPLHTEPEVTLLVYSRYQLNQIEAVRNVSQSVPVGMKVVVKEHPAAVGKRPQTFYRKLIEIPNVLLAAPTMSSRTLVDDSQLVATIAGSIGWEAVLRRKPVIVLGHAPYEFLPDSMVRRVLNLEGMAAAIGDLLTSYEYREDAVTAYVAATMSESVGLNLYSTLLRREGVHSAGRKNPLADDEIRRDVRLLADYTLRSLEEQGRDG